VPASLPYFLPLPLLSPFGTMGAVIAMPRRIKSRNALLDIGAAGPLAGMVIAIPVLAYGLALSEVRPNGAEHFVQEGQSILYWLLKLWVLGPIPAGSDVFLHPTALAGWAGFLVTMINLLPWGQLDGGHIAYALLGPVQHQVARLVRLSLLGLFLYNLAVFLLPVLNHQSKLSIGDAVTNSLFWLIWFGFLGAIAWLSRGEEHPPTEPGTLTPMRQAVAIVSLVLFVILFMPTPWAVY
jgi:membrane-associated protease RseP (regulator of RpoE activity)